MSDEELARFVEGEYPRLVGFLSLHVGDRHVAEELAQEALTRTCSHWKRVRWMDNPSAWVARVGLNLANSHYRRRAAERSAKERLGTRPPQVWQEPENAVALREALKTLPPRTRAALALRFYLDLPFAEVADVMQVPVPTAKSLVRRGLQSLRGSGIHQGLDEGDE